MTGSLTWRGQRSGGALDPLKALFRALVALIGSLYLSMGMGLKACPLCLYQRTFVIGVVGILGVGLVVGGIRTGLAHFAACLRPSQYLL